MQVAGALITLLTNSRSHSYPLYCFVTDPFYSLSMLHIKLFDRHYWRIRHAHTEAALYTHAHAHTHTTIHTQPRTHTYVHAHTHTLIRVVCDDTHTYIHSHTPQGPAQRRQQQAPASRGHRPRLRGCRRRGS